MEPTVGGGLLLTAGVLGVTHGIEPDHVAGITALTQEASDPWLSALVGGCFAVGHTVLVVLWITIAYLLFGTTSFPPALEQIGLLCVGVVLSLLSLYLGISGTRKLVHEHSHDHGGEQHDDHGEGRHSHYHVHLPTSIIPGTRGHRDHEYGDDNEYRHDHGHAHDHSHGAIEYLKIGTVGALFTLSPPVSMIAFISVTVADSSSFLITGVVTAYAVAITATMALVGGGVGALFEITKARGERFHALTQVVASVLVLAFGVDLLAGVVPGILS